MNILLLGGTGYLGSNILRKLNKESYTVFCVVRHSSNISRLNIPQEQIVYNDYDCIEKLFKSVGIDWVINSVCTYKPTENLYGDMLDSNVIFPLGVLNLAIKYQVKNYLTIGTGLPDRFNVYSFTKSKFSEFGEYLCERDHINFVDLELELFYGGMNEPKERFFHACKRKMILGENIQLTNGLQKRDIIRTEDVVDIICFVIKNQIVSGYRRLPVGSGEQHTIREVLEYMKRKIQSKSNLEFGVIRDRGSGEPDTLADISWYRQYGYDLNYSFWGGVDDYINRTIDKEELS